MHFAKILQEISYVRARTDGSNILSLDDPELFNYPIAYMAEPGDWMPTDKEAESFRAYLKKGGFVIFDDFREREGAWINLQDQMRRVLPEARWIEIGDGSQQVWHAFFEIKVDGARAASDVCGWGFIEYGESETTTRPALIAIATSTATRRSIEIADTASRSI